MKVLVVVPLPPPLTGPENATRLLLKGDHLAGDWLTSFTYLVHENGVLSLVGFRKGTMAEARL